MTGGEGSTRSGRSRFRLRSRRLRVLVAVVAALVPARARRVLYRRLLGHDLASGVVIGRSYVDVDHLVMAPGASIGSLNVIRGCEIVSMDRDARIGSLNFVNAVRARPGIFEGIPRRPALVMGQASLVSAMHFVDACDEVELAPWARLAGFLSLVQTHTIDFDRIRQSARPVRIGDHAFVGSRTVLLPGSAVADRSIVAAGSVVCGHLTEPAVYAGVPARPIRDVDPSSPFFVRTVVDLA